MSTELVQTQQRGELTQLIEVSLTNPDITPEKLKALFDFKVLVEDREAKKRWEAAFAAAKAEMDGITITKHGQIMYKTGPGPKFARYEDISRVIKPILTKHGLTASYTSRILQTHPKWVCVMRLTHAGHTQEFESVPLPFVDASGGKNDVQGAGSVSSYGRRYVIVPTFDIATVDEDDDGSGNGIPDLITEDQARRIEDMVQEFENRRPGFAARFAALLKTEFQVDSPAALNTEQYPKVIEKLTVKR